MTFQPNDKTFKKFGVVLEQAFSRLNEGLNMVESLDRAAEEHEREVFTALTAVQVHHSWHSIIKLFRRIANEVDNGVPKGTGAGRKLLEQMMQRTNERPSILDHRHREMAQKIAEFHREFRNANIRQHSRREVVEFIEFMNDEIVPGILENVRLLALAAPGGGKYVTHLGPKGGNDQSVDCGDVKKSA